MTRCDPERPFAGLGRDPDLDPTETVDGLALAADQREVVYAIVDGPRDRLRHARRAALDGPWTVTTDTTNVDVGAVQSLSSDALTLYTTPGPGKAFVLRRANRSDPFQEAVAFETEPAPMFDNGYFISGSGDLAYFAAFGATTDEAVLATIPVRGDGAALFGTHTLLAETHVAGARDGSPVINTSGTVLYFWSNRPQGSVWTVRRGRPDESFGPPTHVSELDDGATFIGWVSDDDCDVYFLRDRGVFSARRPLP